MGTGPTGLIGPSVQKRVEAGRPKEVVCVFLLSSEEKIAGDLQEKRLPVTRMTAQVNLFLYTEC